MSGSDPAFPVDLDLPHKARGLTKRELFAAMAMVGLLAGSEGETSWHEKNFAIGAINLADALLAELEKKP